jgi:DNA-binding transcriptional ArsR family regulator
MAANLRHSITGEQNRLLILEALKGKELSTLELRTKVNMGKSQISNYLISLQISGHIVANITNKNGYIYKRTNKPFYTMAMKDKIVDADYAEAEQSEPAPINAHARVVRLLDKPLDPPPQTKKRKAHLYSGIQSGLQGFGGW